MRISRSNYQPSQGVSKTDGKAGRTKGAMSYRVVHKNTGDERPPKKPDWSKIPTKRQAPLTEEEWEREIVFQARADAKFGKEFSGQAESLLIAYISKSSPDRKGIFEMFYNEVGNKLNGFKTGDGIQMESVDGKWEYNITKAEAYLIDKFMTLYAQAYEAARSGTDPRKKGISEKI